MTINVLLVTADCRPISFQAGSWMEAATRAIDSAEDETIAHVYMAETSRGCGIEEHTILSLRDDLAAGRIPTNERA